MKQGTIVKYANPQDGEAEFRFKVIDFDERSQRVQMQLVDSGMFIAPVETVDASEVAPLPIWEQEHGAQFAVPEAIAKAQWLEDQSWHNDACPIFNVKGAQWLGLWVDHPEKEKREFPESHRFSVVINGDLCADETERAAFLRYREVMAKLNGECGDGEYGDLYGGDNEREAIAAIMAYPLAREFCAILKEWHTPEQMAEIARRNDEEQNPGICHSHDFCDANQAMLDAYEKLTGAELDVTAEDFGLIDSAWNIAKAARFNL